MVKSTQKKTSKKKTPKKKSKSRAKPFIQYWDEFLSDLLHGIEDISKYVKTRKYKAVFEYFRYFIDLEKTANLLNPFSPNEHFYVINCIYPERFYFAFFKDEHTFAKLKQLFIKHDNFFNELEERTKNGEGIFRQRETDFYEVHKLYLERYEEIYNALFNRSRLIAMDKMIEDVNYFFLGTNQPISEESHRYNSLKDTFKQLLKIKKKVLKQTTLSEA